MNLQRVISINPVGIKKGLKKKKTKKKFEMTQGCSQKSSHKTIEQTGASFVYSLQWQPVARTSTRNARTLSGYKINS